MEPSSRSIAGVAVGVSFTLVACGLFACSPSALDLSSKACPCASGWTCEPATRRCVPEVAPSRDVVDAATDSPAPTDGGAERTDGDSTADGGGASGDLGCPPPYGEPTAIVDDAGPPADGGKNCRVHADGILRCTNDSTALFAAPVFGSPRVDDLWSIYTGFICFEYGDKHPNGNSTWYMTCGNLNKVKGYVSAKLLHTHSSFDADPSKYGLRRCSPPSADGGDEGGAPMRDASDD